VQRYLRIAALLTVMISARAGLAHAVELESGACASQEKKNSTLAAPGGITALDRAFCEMYDLDFAKAESELAQFTRQHPEDPLGPVAQAASALFSIFEQNEILQTEFFTSDDRYTKRQKIVPDAAALQHFDLALRRADKVATECLARNTSDQSALAIRLRFFRFRPLTTLCVFGSFTPSMDTPRCKNTLWASTNQFESL
jgi:hypothetical protein